MTGPKLRAGKKLRPRSVPVGWAWCLVAVLAFTGCRASTTRQLAPGEVSLPALSETREELLARLLRLSDAVDTIRSSVTYEASVALEGDSERRYRPTDGALIASRTSMLRMRGDVPLGITTAFDMSADAEEFRLWVPPNDEFFTGSNQARFEHENPMVNLRPQHILSSLFVNVRPYLESEDFVTVVTQVPEGVRSYYVVEFIETFPGSPGRGSVVERLFVDRFDLQVARKRLFNAEGQLELDVEYSDHRDVAGVPFPGAVFIQRPLEDYALRIEFHDPDLNVELDENVFVLPIPEGITVTVLEDAEDLTDNETLINQNLTATPE